MVVCLCCILHEDSLRARESSFSLRDVKLAWSRPMLCSPKLRCTLCHRTGVPRGGKRWLRACCALAVRGASPKGSIWVVQTLSPCHNSDVALCEVKVAKLNEHAHGVSRMHMQFVSLSWSS